MIAGAIVAGALWSAAPGVPPACAFEGVAAHVAELAGAPRGTAEFLRVVAWRESRCTITATGDSGAAVGAFQMHPAAAAGRLKNPARAAVLAARSAPMVGTWIAAAYVSRVRARIVRRCGSVTWGAVRRAWRRPALACSRSEEARAVDRRWETAKRAING